MLCLKEKRVLVCIIEHNVLDTNELKKLIILTWLRMRTKWRTFVTMTMDTVVPKMRVISRLSSP